MIRGSIKYNFCFLAILCCILSACSTTKFVPEGKLLLNKTKIEIEGTKDVTSADLKAYLRQKNNSEILGFWKLQLQIYNTAPTDTTTKSKKRLARNAHRMGEAPVIFDADMSSASMNQLQLVMQNKGYFNAQVDTTMFVKDRKLSITYHVKANEPYQLRNCSYLFPQADLKSFATDKERTLLKEGMLFDAQVLDEERQRISSAMRRNGYYFFDKELIKYTADSSLNARKVDIEMGLQNYIGEWSNEQKKRLFTKYIVSDVHFHMDYDPAFVPENATVVSSQKDKYYFTWINQTLLRERTLIKNCLIRPGEVFNERLVELTYERFNRLGIVKYVDISFDPVSDNELECHIVLSRSKLNSISANIEGTYSAGDWGIAAGLGYINKNIFKGAEELSLNAGVGYEWRANGGRAIEAEAEAGLKFPNQLNVNLMYNYQTRPNEFTRTIANADLSYRIARRRSKWTHDFRFVDISYVYLPWISKEFSETFLKPTNILKYSYEDHLIAAFSYGCTYSSFREKQPLRSFSTLNMQVELAGNLLYALSLIAKLPQNADGAYTIGKIPFSQYVKADVSYVYNQIFNEKHRLVYHAALGVAIPFGNAQTIPFEKRYFSGGSNSLRGWTIRSLGPGGYQSTGGRIDYNNQSGDIRLDLNLEYRFKVWSFIELAAFTDAGNIWTIRPYEAQTYGDFQWDRFYQEIAWSYGAGLRLDFTFLVFRLDFGFKLYDPSRLYHDNRAWRTAKNGLNWKEDAAVHFAIGYPF